MEKKTQNATLEALTPAAEELAAINALTLRPYTAEELFTFKVIASSTAVDRDFEAFTLSALQEMAEKYVGKTVIFDHNPTAHGQVARVYAAEVIEEAGAVPETGEPNAKMQLRLFMPRIRKNEGLIAELECGIKNEVSVAAAIGHSVCSICGEETEHCVCENGHMRGQIYDGKRCVYKLSSVEDVYELSFVAVPANPQAGTTKAAKPKAQTEHKKTALDGFLKFIKKGDKK